MAEMTISGASHDLTVDGSELFSAIAEGDDFCWAHERKVSRVEEEHQVFSFVVRQGYFSKIPIGSDSLSGKIWSWVLYAKLRRRHNCALENTDFLRLVHYACNTVTH